MPTLAEIRTAIDQGTYADEARLVADLTSQAGLDAGARSRIAARASGLVADIRRSASPGLMEVFLAEYGLSTDEGVALMCLAEALLRVPDGETMDALIEDKIVPSDWGRHLGQSASSLVNASTWALLLTGKVLDEDAPGPARVLRMAIKRVGEPVIRAAAARAMREMGQQFVLGETIGDGLRRAKDEEAQGYTYSYDMLGEAARTAKDAARYFQSYADAIAAIGAAAQGNSVRTRPGISVKLSALHPRYEVAQQARVMAELVPRVQALARHAAAADLGFNIDAEEAARLSLSLDVIEATLADPALKGWDGFGVVVQAYGRRAGAVIDWLDTLAQTHGRRLMVRLVKGAYWDTEIKHAQVIGAADFPVFTTKPATDVSYIACARKLLAAHDRLYPQFATHNAHTVAAILDMAETRDAFEFQRLHGMGERLHDIILRTEHTRCRIYAPVGAHRDLLAYLVRRLLENGANSSFVNQIVDESVPPAEVAADPFAALGGPAVVVKAPDLFGAGRQNARGWDLDHAGDLAEIAVARDPHADTQFDAAPLIAGPATPEAPAPVLNPANPADRVGQVATASLVDIETALAAATAWAAPRETRQTVLLRAADLYEAAFGEFFALLAREAGKTLPDAVSELREAVDFLRYYAARAGALERPGTGIFTCISPWNFPLAIFTGQIAGALAAGNGVLAKPAEQTPLMAAAAVRLLREAGVPAPVLQLLPGDGRVGAALTSDPRVSGVAFTGSTETAEAIRRAMAAHLAPGAPLIAETGGLNAMIVDSTALAEQAVRDIVVSAFQSAGQRCSALRCLYVQEDIAAPFTEMLTGAMDELGVGAPWALSTDVGPVIDAAAQAEISTYLAANADRTLHQIAVPTDGHWIAPTVLAVRGIADLPREIFGPVLHLATFAADGLDQVIGDINARGFGLTFGLHTRIDGRVQHIVERINAGNIYVNRNQIGAVVGSQPFGGEGLSGTGPKAGGPHYLNRFGAPERVVYPAPDARAMADPRAIQAALAAAEPSQPADTAHLPGPTGELNRLAVIPRPPLLCLGPGEAAAAQQAGAITALGGAAVEVADALAPEALQALHGFSGVLWWGDDATGRAYAQALAQRGSPILPLITGSPDRTHACLERHLCVDTTAAGGNAALLAEVSSA